MKVGDEYRTNPLSLEPGGFIVTVVFNNGRTLEYDKVKSPRKYVERIPDKDNISHIYINGGQVWSSEELTKYWEQK